jgi:tetratricopeptide (TPR) repeat protein
LMGKVVKDTRDWPPHVANWLNLGFTLHKEEEVQPVYERWCQENPEYSQVSILRASLLLRDDRTEEGLTEVRRGLKVAPYNVKLSRMLVKQLADKGQPEAALKEADRLVEFAGNDYACCHLRLLCLAKARRLDDALDYLAALVKKFPEHEADLGTVRTQLEALKQASPRP